VSGELDGLVALVTGGASGIGAAIVAELMAGGARVAILDLNAEDGQTDGSSLAVTCDVTDDPSCRAAVQAVVDHFGQLDIVVNNAGIGAQGTVADNDDDEWHRVFDVNVVGMVRITRAALPHLRASRAASVVNTCSVAATAGLPQRVLYSATKGAVLAMSRAMAADHVREGIRVNCVNPGTADTPGSGDCSARPPTPMPTAGPWRLGSRTAGWSVRRRSPGPWRTWPARGRARRPGSTWRSTAVCRACGCARRVSSGGLDGGCATHRAEGGPRGRLRRRARGDPGGRGRQAAGQRRTRLADLAGRPARLPPGGGRGLRRHAGGTADDPDNQAWQATVAPFFDQADSYAGDDSGLRRLWTLAEQLGRDAP
jgi:NAD(P)-dependent dehydrogenase (short-subunit alcohol dehydrogenase family)